MQLLNVVHRRAGLGDRLASLPWMEGLREAGVVVGAYAPGDMLGHLAANATGHRAWQANAPAAAWPSLDRLMRRGGPAALERLRRSWSHRAGVEIHPRPPRIMPCRRREVPDGAVLIAPQAHHGARLWNPAAWAAVAHLVRRTTGRSVVGVCGDPSWCPWADVTYRFGTVLGLLWACHQAAAVVSVDTGIAHAAAMVDAPLVAVVGPTRGLLPTVWPGATIRELSGTTPGCAGCMFRGPYEPEVCGGGCAVIRGIQIDEVVDAVAELARDGVRDAWPRDRRYVPHRHDARGSLMWRLRARGAAMDPAAAAAIARQVGGCRGCPGAEGLGDHR